MMNPIQVLVVVFLTIYAGTGFCSTTGTEQLKLFFSSLSLFRADFEQSVVDDRHSRIQNSTGKMAIKRPGLFRWDYEKPYYQQIVGDGGKVWIYDRDLEQITVKPQGEALGSTPAQLLSSSEPLEKTFVVTELGQKDDAAWVELLPRGPEAVFTSIRLGFNQTNLVAMELNDHLGNRTTIRFTNVERNPVVDPKTFVFTPPAGVDIIGQ